MQLFKRVDSGAVELTGERITLRPYRPQDALLVYEAACESVTAVQPWLPWCHPGYTKKESDGWIKISRQAWKKGTAYEFAIFDRINGSFLGGCGLNQFNPAFRFCNLGYWVRTSQTRRGVASEAVRLVARFGFRELKLNRIEIVAAVGNEPSQRTAARAGAKREGVVRNRLELATGPVDAVLFSIIPADLTA